MRSQSEITHDWVRYYCQMLTPESRLGALRGAGQDGVLGAVLKALEIKNPVELVEKLHLGNEKEA